MGWGGLGRAASKPMARGYRLGNPLVWLDPTQPDLGGLASPYPVYRVAVAAMAQRPDGHPGRTNVVVKTVV